MSGAVIAFPRQHRRDLWRELARRMREAAELSLRAHGIPRPRLLKEAARLEAEANRCDPQRAPGRPA